MSAMIQKLTDCSDVTRDMGTTLQTPRYLATLAMTWMLPAACGRQELGDARPAARGAALAASTTLSCARFDERTCCWGQADNGVEMAAPTPVPLPGAAAD